MTLISTKTIRELEPSLAPASQPGPTIVGGVRCSVDSSGEVFIIIIIVIIIIIIITIIIVLIITMHYRSVRTSVQFGPQFSSDLRGANN